MVFDKIDRESVTPLWSANLTKKEKSEVLDALQRIKSELEKIRERIAESGVDASLKQFDDFLELCDQGELTLDRLKVICDLDSFPKKFDDFLYLAGRYSVPLLKLEAVQDIRGLFKKKGLSGLKFTSVEPLE